MILYHVTTPKKARLYHASGGIKPPVRGFDSMAGAMAWAIKVGRKIIYEIEVPEAWMLPDHHNDFGTAYWHDEIVPVTKIKCVLSFGGPIDKETP